METETTPLTLKAFVIGPIGDKDAADGSPARTAYEEGIQIFEEVISPACVGFALEATRADMISRVGEIPEQIFRQLRDCPVVIADLTGANPNVMYELGLRHTTGRVTIQIGEKGRLPFDVAAIRTIIFKRTEAGLVQARKDLSKALAANLDTGGDPVTATRIWFESSSIQESLNGSNSQGILQSVPEDDSPGFLELLAEMETGIQALTQITSATTSIIEEIAKVYSEATVNIQQSDARREGVSARLAIAEHTARKLDEQATRLEVLSGDYARTVDRIEPGIEYLVGRIAEEPDQLAEAPEFLPSIRTLCSAALGTVDVTLTMRRNSIEMGGISRSMKRVGQRLASSFKRFADSSTRIGGWINLIDKVTNRLAE